MINQKLMFLVMAMKFLKTLILLWAKNGRIHIKKKRKEKKRKAPKSPELQKKYCKTLQEERQNAPLWSRRAELTRFPYGLPSNLWLKMRQ